ncbi:MAG: Calx-beta domain-containing protein, partial [Actinomycetota bacterium]
VQSVAVSWATADGTATAPGDYEQASGALAFGPGETSKVVSIAVLGDVTPEPVEEFYVDIASADVAIADTRGVGTIIDNDPLPSLAISDVTVAEGTGGTKTVQLVVSLSSASGGTVTVVYQTVDGTAKAPSDYLAASGLVTFNPGETSKAVNVTVVGDALSERTEWFTVALSNPSGASISDSSGRCSLLNDD